MKKLTLLFDEGIHDLMKKLHEEKICIVFGCDVDYSERV